MAVTAWDCADDEYRRKAYEGMAADIERLRRENDWLSSRLHDAVNVCYGGVSHEQIDARSFDS
jgi:hypothetical protein